MSRTGSTADERRWTQIKKQPWTARSCSAFPICVDLRSSAVKSQPQNGGEIRNGKSNGQKVTPLQLARAVGLSRNTIYRRLDEGDVDARLIEYAGPREILFQFDDRSCFG